MGLSIQDPWSPHNDRLWICPIILSFLTFFFFVNVCYHRNRNKTRSGTCLLGNCQQYKTKPVWISFLHEIHCKYTVVNKMVLFPSPFSYHWMHKICAWSYIECNLYFLTSSLCLSLSLLRSRSSSRSHSRSRSGAMGSNQDFE